MKRIISFAIIIILTVSLLVIPTNAAPDGKWVLVDVIDHEYKGDWSLANQSEVYNYKPSYSRGSYSSTTQYIGKTDTYYNPPYIHGESLTVQAIWSAPPQTMGKDETVVLNVSIAETENTQSAYKFAGSTRAFWGSSDIKNSTGNYFYQVYWSSDPAKHYKAISDKVSFIPGSGSEGQKKSLWITYYSGNKLETEYIYEWTSSNKTPVNPLTHNYTASAPPQTKPVQATDTKYKDTGIKVSDIYGEVLIRRGDNEDVWEFLEINSIIYEGDHIKTSGDSGAIIAMPDMTTFNIKEESEIIATMPSGEDSKFKLVLGNIYANVKEMVTHGTMEVEMSQAVCGIKGTTFILTETGSSSAVKVLEGSVEFKSIKTGKSAEVKAGSSAIVTKGSNPVVKSISIVEEAKAWRKTIIELQLNNKYMKVNGVQSEIDPGRGTMPAVVSSRTLIPIRSVIEALGGTIGYDAKEQKITIKLNNKTLEMWINKTALKLNGKAMTMDVAPMAINSRTMVPVRFVAENFGYDVEWKQTDKRIIIQ